MTFIKRIITALLAFAIVFSCNVFADDEITVADKWQKPQNVTLESRSNTEMNYLYNFKLSIGYDKGDDLIAYLSQNDGKGIKARAQIDWAIDYADGAWLYDEFKDEWDALNSQNSKVWDYSGSGDDTPALTTSKHEERDILNLYRNNQDEWNLSGLKDRVGTYTYTMPDAFFVDVSFIDLTRHTIYARVRFVTQEKDGTTKYSDWSDTVAVGKSASANDSAVTENNDDVQNIDVSWISVSDWAVDTVKASVKQGVFPKKLDKEDLTRKITRREFAMIISQVINKLNLDVTLPSENPFADTLDNDVLIVYGAGIMYGKANDMFAPMDSLTREEAATILARVYDSAVEKGVIKAAAEKRETVFADEGKISLWAKDSAYKMYSLGIMEGVGNNAFAPNDDTTIEQALALALRVIGM